MDWVQRFGREEEGKRDRTGREEGRIGQRVRGSERQAEVGSVQPTHSF